MRGAEAVVIDGRTSRATRGCQPLRVQSTRGRAWADQIRQLRTMARAEGDSRFYYTGLAQAAVLDRLAPGWQAQAFEPGVWLEDLLRAAVAPD